MICSRNIKAQNSYAVCYGFGPYQKAKFKFKIGCNVIFLSYFTNLNSLKFLIFFNNMLYLLYLLQKRKLLNFWIFFLHWCRKIFFSSVFSSLFHGGVKNFPGRKKAYFVCLIFEFYSVHIKRSILTVTSNYNSMHLKKL